MRRYGRVSAAVLPQFLAMGKRGSATDREMGLRRRLLAEAEALEPSHTTRDSLGAGVLARAEALKKRTDCDPPGRLTAPPVGMVASLH